MTPTPLVAAAGPRLLAQSQTADEAKPKRYRPPTALVKRFGTKPVVSPGESSQPAAKGLLISACLETETASASNSRTGGLSAFTYSVLRGLEGHREGATTREVFARAAAVLKDLGFSQTPQYLADNPGQLDRTFITMEEPTMAIDTNHSANTTDMPIAISEQEVQDKLFTAFVRQLPAIVEAANGQQLIADEEDEQEESAAVAPAPATADAASEKVWQAALMWAAKEVGERVYDEVKERVGGKKERDRTPQIVVRRGHRYAQQKAVNFGGLARAAARNLEEEMLPVLLNMARNATPAVISLIQEQLERSKKH